VLLTIFYGLRYSLRSHSALQIHLYLALDDVIHSMGTPHSGDNDDGDSDVELGGGGWWKGFFAGFLYILLENFAK